ncbi:hypothetical protein SAMN02745687_00829 [Lachnospiraceae bacterium NK3A20]|nr:hypothetical protein SAMN02745687_00829 [Lachnospiraceae bacterium NK3A20]
MRRESRQTDHLPKNTSKVTTPVVSSDTRRLAAGQVETDREVSTDNLSRYTEGTHMIGRIATLITLAMLIGAPFVIGLYLGALPDLGAAAKAFLAVGLVWTVSSVVEFLVYTPMLGSGGGYLAFISGNLINMKIPCAMNAREIVGTKTGTPENEIVSTLSIAASSLVTILVLAVGVLLLVPLQPILQSEMLAPAFDNVVPALFGAMAYQYYRKNWKLALVPLVLMSLLFIAVPSLASQTSILILPAGAITIALAWLQFRSGEGRSRL